MRIDPVLFAVVLPTLWAAHNLGDHIAQTDRMAACKGRPAPDANNPPTRGEQARAMAGHITTYQATQAAALAVTLTATRLRPTAAGLLAGALCSAVSHAFLDRRWPVRWILQRSRSPKFADLQTPINGPYQADQALHHGCLWVSALLMALR